MHKHCSQKNRYYSSSIEMGYCGSDVSEINETHIETSLIHTGSWGIESFEQTSISVPTKIKVASHDSFFVHADSVNNLADLTRQIAIITNKDRSYEKRTTIFVTKERNRYHPGTCRFGRFISWRDKRS